MARSTRRKPTSRDSERTLIRTGVTGGGRVSAAAGAVARIGDAVGPASAPRRATGMARDGGEPGPGARPSPKRAIRARTVLREMPSATAVCEMFQLVRTSAAWRCSLICLCQDSGSGSGSGQRRGGRRGRSIRDGQAERGGGDDRRIAQQDHPLEDIAELPDIAGPGVAGERVARVGRERPLGEPVVRAGPCQEVLGEDQHVEAALAERRQVSA